MWMTKLFEERLTALADELMLTIEVMVNVRMRRLENAVAAQGCVIDDLSRRIDELEAQLVPADEDDEQELVLH